MKIIVWMAAGMLLASSAFAQEKNFHSFTVQNIVGKDYPLSQLKGKKVLVVNTASKCGLTPQYEDLQKLYEQYQSDSFEIIAFPANNFMNQEPGSNEEILQFCEDTYAVTFPVMSKISVRGNDIHPVYKWLTTKEENGLEDSKVSWNFQKYLINEEGELVGHFSPKSSPLDPDIIAFITGQSNK